MNKFISKIILRSLLKVLIGQIFKIEKQTLTSKILSIIVVYSELRKKSWAFSIKNLT